MSSSSPEPPRFASFDVTGQVFYQTRLTLGIVNLMPLVPGHVLLIPRRTSARRLADLTADEVGDLFSSVQKVSAVVERVHRAGSLTVAVQDGPYAGQSVPHLHVHILPRNAGDIEPADAVYERLDGGDYAAAFEQAKREFRTEGKGRVKMDVEGSRAAPRTKDEMAAEAGSLAGEFAPDERPPPS